MSDRNEFHNDLEVFCSAKDHKRMVRIGKILE